jgi:hypothetical protein
MWNLTADRVRSPRPSPRSRSTISGTVGMATDDASRSRGSHSATRTRKYLAVSSSGKAAAVASPDAGSGPPGSAYRCWDA